MDFYAQTTTGQKLTFAREGNTYRLDKALFQTETALEICNDAFDAVAGQPGFYLLPGHMGYPGSNLVFFTHRADAQTVTQTPSLSLYAVGTAKGTYAVLIERSYSYRLHAQVKNGNYRCWVEIDLQNQHTQDDIVLTVLPLPAGADYNAVAAAVREYYLARGEIRTLKEKCTQRPLLDYNRRHPLVRIRMAWKPAPSPQPHQTPENEPEMHLACTFARVRELADEMHRQGVQGAEITLVGWNIKGHDGRWPQIFPVEEACGGEEELKKTIAHCQKLGYTITPHTNLLDHYEIAENFDWDNIARKKDGTPVQNGEWSGGMAYRACPHAQLAAAKRDLPRVAALGFKGLEYTDVLSIIEPDVCFHPDHPCTLRQGIERMQQAAAYTAQMFGGFSSEGCMDFVHGQLDFSLYNNMSKPWPQEGELADRNIRMVELIYHGIFLYNCESNMVNYPIKPTIERNKLFTWGGRPAFYIYSKFHQTSKWMGADDLIMDTQEQLVQCAKAIAEAEREYAYFAEKQLEFISSYRQLDSGLFETVFSGGDRVFRNDTDVPVETPHGTVLPLSYLIVRA